MITRDVTSEAPNDPVDPKFTLLIPFVEPVLTDIVFAEVPHESIVTDMASDKTTVVALKALTDNASFWPERKIPTPPPCEACTLDEKSILTLLALLFGVNDCAIACAPSVI